MFGYCIIGSTPVRRPSNVGFRKSPFFNLVAQIFVMAGLADIAQLGKQPHSDRGGTDQGRACHDEEEGLVLMM